MPLVRIATIVGLLLLGVGVLWPLASAFTLVWSTSFEPVVGTPGSLVIRHTVFWSILVPVVALLPGLPAGYLLGRLLAHPRATWAACSLTLAPLCVPGYAIFWCWWQTLGPGSTLGAWAITHDVLIPLKQWVLLLALVSWCWPLIAWPVALASHHRGTSAPILAALDGARRAVRLRFWIRALLPGCLLGMVLAGLLVASATVSFDLAQISTVGFELRALDALGASPAQLIWYSWPSFLVAGLCTFLILVSLRRGTERWHNTLSHRMVRSQFSIRSAWILPVLVLLSLSSLLPILLTLGRLGNLEFGVFWSLYGPAVLRTIGGALLNGLICAGLAVLLHIQFSLGGSRSRALALLMGAGWLLVGRLPSATLAAIVSGTFNTPSFGPLLYDSSFALLLAEVANLAGFGCLIALLVASIESRSARRIRELDPPRLSGITPGLTSTALLAFVVTAVFSLGELVLATRLGLPGRERIATGLLNAMHYQRPDTVMIGLMALVFCGWLMALLIGRFVSRRLIGHICVLGLAVLPVLGLPGCSDTSEPGSTADISDSLPEIPHDLVFGAPGGAEGLFVTPRGLAVDPRDESIYVVDKTARIQHFGRDGSFINQWAMPESTVGRPVGISVSPDGRIFVPDTHYHRILVFDSNGTELNRFGSFGTGPGEFVYPTDVVFGPEGELYIAEYGTNDRVQVFDPDGRYLRQFGASGRGEGEFTRPQSMVFSEDHSELFIADSCNHRVVVVDPQGNWQRVLGGPGRSPGQFCYPYGVDLLPDGSLLVCEYGSGRLQRLDPRTGAVLEVYGGPGIKKGRLREPWGVVAHGDRVLVLDSGNARVQIGALE